MEPALWAEMGTTDTGADEPRLVVVWLDPTVSRNCAVSFAFAVAARVTEIRPEDGYGWSLLVPDQPTRTDKTTSIIITARTWPRSEVEAAEALAVFEQVAEEARALRREVEELARGLPDLTLSR